MGSSVYISNYTIINRRIIALLKFILPDIIFADGVGNLNCVSKYLGKKVYKPAMGKMWRTLLAVRNMRMSFFKSRFTVFGKSENNYNYYMRI